MLRWLGLGLLAFVCAGGACAFGGSSPDNEPPSAENSDDPIEPQKRVGSAHERSPFIRTFAHDEWRIWSSPFRQGNWDAHTVKKYIIPFGLISTALIASDHRSQNLLPNTNDQTKWAGRISQMGAAYTLAGFSGATLAFGAVTNNDHAAETGWLALQAIAHSQVVVFAIKQLTNRNRPVYYDQTRSGFWRGGDSFPSGHSMTSWAVASVFAHEYRDRLAVPIAAYSIASLVSLSRTGARRHWFSDIFVGGSMGFLIGRFVYKQHHDPALPGSKAGRNRASWLRPEVQLAPGGAGLAWRF